MNETELRSVFTTTFDVLFINDILIGDTGLITSNGNLESTTVFASTMSDQGKTQNFQPSLRDPNSKYSKESIETEDYDSGILSGPISTFSKPSDHPPKKDDRKSVTHIDTYVDSGVIDDQEPFAKSSSQMFLDKEHIGVADKLSNLQLETSKSLNNLNQNSDTAKKQPTSTAAATQSTQEDVCKLCYRQNAEGDT